MATHPPIDRPARPDPAQPAPLHLLDSISTIGAASAGAVVVSGSHGGLSAANFVLALRDKPLAVFYNDAGVGKDNAGIVALDLLEAAGVACAVYSHESARIGEARDGYENGRVSRVNRAARACGLEPGQTVREAVQRLVST